ncbi:MAG: hypothetical protein MRK02_11610 [Candidatus Scalindua sp.]|nr:hypothetical protein [Candidatus Scalindua sp.]
MKIPYPVKCNSCNTKTTYMVNAEDWDFNFQCKCGSFQLMFIQTNIFLSKKFLLRSQFELNENKDFSFSIILSAIAIEAELARLYRKWRKTEALKNKILLKNHELEEELRKQSSILNKIKITSSLMIEGGVDTFVKNNHNINGLIKEGYPSIKLNTFSKSIQELIFYTRNRILHMGRTNYTEEDALRIWNLSLLFIFVLQEIDKLKKGHLTRRFIVHSKGSCNST